MTARIHPTAVVDPGATLGLDVVVEPFALIGPDVQIGAGTTVGPRATITGRTTIGAGCSIGVGAVLGVEPQDRKYAGEDTALVIGDETIVREYASIHRGTVASGQTVLGRRCFIMAYVHIAHDCVLEDDVLLANAVQLGGHVAIGAHAQVGGLTPIHQFVRIGRYAFVGGGSRVPQDVPPFARAAGNPIRLYGVNAIGLRRAGFDADRRGSIQHAYRLLFNSRLSRREAIDQLRETTAANDDVRHLVEFLQGSERGVMV